MQEKRFNMIIHFSIDNDNLDYLYSILQEKCFINVFSGFFLDRICPDDIEMGQTARSASGCRGHPPQHHSEGGSRLFRVCGTLH